MKNIILSFITFFGIILSVQSQNNLKYDHQALPVNNLKITGDFYRDILGFKDIPTLVGTKDSHRWLANYEGKEIHLIFSNDEIQKTPKQIHMAFSPLDFEKFIDHLKMNNVVFTNYKLKAGVVQVRNDGIKQLWIRDPQGYWIEINSTNQD
ncbi:MAG: VOC family protein [Flavobacteriaceae bacterium]|tara:strand:+ start:93 stop:545 length:453 start_codon:yes stop_codon:yes gene_type:complete